MKILTRYILSELIGPFFIGLGFFTFIFILSPILRLVDMLVVKRVPLGEVLLLFVYLLPST
ncbi:MAG: LptF/LptG family permease, partial [bacterium]|nr:LptF/LptG family permease [bacterium]